MNKSINIKSIKDDFSTFLDQHGISISDFAQIMPKEIVSDTFKMSPSLHEQFKEKYDRFISEPCSNTKEKGDRLEELTHFLLFNSTNDFVRCIRNCRTSSNELDMLCDWNDEAKLLNLSAIIPDCEDGFICECKNYSRPASVTYVGKFSSLLMVAHRKVGFFIAWNGVTGQNSWEDANGLIRKIALATQTYIIVIDKNDFEQIYLNTRSIFDIIQAKLRSLKDDISYEALITPHESSEKFSSNNDPPDTAP